MSFKFYQIFVFNSSWYLFVFALISGESENSKIIQKHNSVIQKYQETFHPWKQYKLVLKINIPNIE